MLAGDEPLGVQIALDRKAWELRLLQDVRAAVAGKTELIDIFRTIVNQVADAFGYGQVGLYLVDRDQLVLQHQVGFEHPIATMPLRRGVIGRAIRTREAQLVRDVTTDLDYVSALGDVHSEICCPFFVDDRVAGVLNVEGRQGRVFDEDDLAVLCEISSFLDLAMRHARLSTVVRSSEERLRLALDAA